MSKKGSSAWLRCVVFGERARGSNACKQHPSWGAGVEKIAFMQGPGCEIHGRLLALLQQVARGLSSRLQLICIEVAPGPCPRLALRLCASRQRHFTQAVPWSLQDLTEAFVAALLFAVSDSAVCPGCCDNSCHACSLPPRNISPKS